MAHEVAGLIGSSTPLDCVRLRAYNPDTGTIGESFARTPTATLTELAWTPNKHLYLEAKLPGTEFPPDSEEVRTSDDFHIRKYLTISSDRYSGYQIEQCHAHFWTTTNFQSQFHLFRVGT